MEGKAIVSQQVYQLVHLLYKIEESELEDLLDHVQGLVDDFEHDIKRFKIDPKSNNALVSFSKQHQSFACVVEDFLDARKALRKVGKNRLPIEQTKEVRIPRVIYAVRKLKNKQLVYTYYLEEKDCVRVQTINPKKYNKRSKKLKAILAAINSGDRDRALAVKMGKLNDMHHEHNEKSCL